MKQLAIILASTPLFADMISAIPNVNVWIEYSKLAAYNVSTLGALLGIYFMLKNKRVAKEVFVKRIEDIKSNGGVASNAPLVAPPHKSEEPK